MRDRIHVSSLGAFEFCPRAGIIAFKSQEKSGEVQEEYRIPNLNFLPLFDRELLQEELQLVWQKLWVAWATTSGSFVILWIITRFISTTLAIFLFPALAIAAVYALQQTYVYAFIKIELYRYEHRPAIILGQSHDHAIPIDWWGLVKAGFSPLKPEASYFDEDLGLSGKPWRFLKGNTNECIPVIAHRGEQSTYSGQHLLKLAAYCHLLHKEQHAVSEWGIWLNYETRKGFAIPVRAMLKDWTTVEDWEASIDGVENLIEKQLANKLEEFRKAIETRRQGQDVLIPHASCCLNCPYGKPHLFVINQSETRYPGTGAIGALPQMGNHRRMVHSTCGDEFQWLPPHRYWAERTEN